MMNKELLKEQCEKINDIFAQLSAKQITVTDGVIDVDRYFDAKPRILWILKEANSKESWSYLDALKSTDWLNKCNGLSSIRQVIYISYGILKGIDKDWSEFPWSNESQCQDALLGIAYINIKKSPGESTSNPQELIDAYQTYRELLKLQIDTYDADVIIFGNTMDYVNIAKQEIRIYSLDRVQSLQPTENRFALPAEFDGEQYFANSFGISNNGKAEFVRIKVKNGDKKDRYFRSLPLHHSQEVVEQTEDYTIFQYYIQPTYDFRQELLSHGADVEVLSPKWFREEVSNIIK